MSGTVLRRRRVLVAVLVALLLVGLVPLLRANAVARQLAWEQSCVGGGGWVETVAPTTENPLVVHTGHPILQCRSATGAVLSRRD